MRIKGDWRSLLKIIYHELCVKFVVFQTYLKDYSFSLKRKSKMSFYTLQIVILYHPKIFTHGLSPCFWAVYLVFVE